jgi:SP family galactose:H+ symporter-like MFS transporter
MSMGPLPYIITAEIFPRRVRSAGVAASSAANWLTNFAVSLSFLPLVAILTPQYVWYLYIACNMSAAAFVAFVVPETAGSQLES